ncbi:MAG: 16S rRNA (cytosine(1402)-N(4))-methyltransferase RsmH [Cyanobacteria bacterium P01_H01_bin.74]
MTSQKVQTETVPHTPVLLQAVLDNLNPKPGCTYLDATVGAGGHTLGILESLSASIQASQEKDPKSSTPVLLGLDCDAEALAIASARMDAAGFVNAVTFIQDNFSNIHALDMAVRGQFFPISGGVVADIGVSSMQLDTPERGFSFRNNAPLDMRMNTQADVTAAEIVNTYSEAQLVEIFSRYGEEHLSKTIARQIVQNRKSTPYKTTTALADCVISTYKKVGKNPGKVHPATRVFQALRIAVNRELDALETFLNGLPRITQSGARVVIISFHSLEDRLVKQFFQRAAKACICSSRLPVCQCNHQATFKVMTKKPVSATAEEIKENPRSRSAKLRCAERL